MKTYHLTYPHTLSLDTVPETSAAIGFFDGIHQGHQEVIQSSINYAKKLNMESAVITFHPHPSEVLRPNNEGVKYITPLKQKQAILQKMEVDRLYVITFNKELAGLAPQDFVDHFICGLHIKHLVAGFDYTFGHKGAGNMDNISSMTKGRFTCKTIDKVEANQEKVSSTKIRQLFTEGNMGEVNNLLNRKHRTEGKVVGGDKRGKELGFPTANLDIASDVLLPKKGIYAVKVFYKNISYLGLASLGINPTFTPESNELKLEVHILDFGKEIYGEQLTIEWHSFIRDEMEFTSVDALIAEMKKDEKIAREYFLKE